jgi:hypothetical protein
VTAIERSARRGLWALPVWAALLFYGTLTHQPSTSDFPAYARYVTTPEFLVSHLVASILGAGIGTLGMVALAIVLARLNHLRVARWALVTAVLGNTLVTAVFGAAAFAQPAIGRAYLAGHTDDIVALNKDVYGAPLGLTAFPGIALLTTGILLFGIGVARSGRLPKLAGIGLAIGGPLFAVVGFVLSDFVQSIGAALLLVSAAWIAWTGSRDQPTVTSA